MFTGKHALMPPNERNKHPYLLKGGIDYGPKPPLIIARKGNHAIIKQPGHTGWTGQGETGWYATRYYLVRGSESKADAGARVLDRYSFADVKNVFDIEEILAEREPGSLWRACLKELTTTMETLAS